MFFGSLIWFSDLVFGFVFWFSDLFFGSLIWFWFCDLVLLHRLTDNNFKVAGAGYYNKNYSYCVPYVHGYDAVALRVTYVT